MENKDDLFAATSSSERAGDKGGIVLPAIMWWLGVPLTLVLVLWLFNVI